MRRVEVDRVAATTDRAGTAWGELIKHRSWGFSVVEEKEGGVVFLGSPAREGSQVQAASFPQTLLPAEW